MNKIWNELKLGTSTREAYGKILVELGRKNKDIVVLDADLSKSTYTHLFAKEFPERFFDVGIAEANMVSIASGLASYGKIPFISSFACFLMCKTFDQLRMCVAYPYHNVKVVVSHSGISVGEDGPSQQSIEDIGLACLLPNFVVLVPADEIATRELVKKSVEYFGPVFIRTSRPKTYIIYNENEKFEIGSGKRLSDGKDAAIIACGLMVYESIKAAEVLLNEGIEVSIIDCYSIKPIDENLILEVARETNAVVVAEEHSIYGGLGSIISSLLGKEYPIPIEFIGINDVYAESGKPEELFKRYNLSFHSIATAVKKVIKRGVGG
jgi:transketolase